MDRFHIKTGFENMDVTAIHHYLSLESYWAKGIPFETVKTALEHSFCIGIFEGEQQVGFARLITDYATFAYLADVYVLAAYRGNGLSKMMMNYLLELDFASGLRRILLATLDAHSLYRQFGFQPPANPERFLELKRTKLYEQ